MPSKETVFYNPEEFVPSLREAYDKSPLDGSVLWRAGIPSKPKTPPGTPDLPLDSRNLLIVSDGASQMTWLAPSLQTLFRGDKKAPDLGDIPEGYDIIFAIIETHVLEACRVLGDRTDHEMKDIYAALRKRPDGKSLGVAHDAIWRGAALAMGSHILSQAEFEAVISRLERSCRTFAMSPSSRNYVDIVRKTLSPLGQY